MDTNNLFKYRSVTACMKAAFDLMSDNLKGLLRKTWWAMLPLAAMGTLTLYFRLPNKALHDWGLLHPWSSFLLQTLVYFLYFVCSIVAGTAVWSWMNKKPFKQNILPFLSYHLALYCGIVILAGIGLEAGRLIATPQNPLAMKGIASVAVLVLTIGFCIPFAYLLPRRMLLADDERPQIWASCKAGLRHSGGILAMGFLCAIILGVVCCVFMLPAIVLGGAQLMSQLGALEGDPLGVPTYFAPLLLSVTLAIGFVLNYVALWPWVAYVYLYGSYATQERERKKMKIDLAASQQGTLLPKV